MINSSLINKLLDISTAVANAYVSLAAKGATEYAKNAKNLAASIDSIKIASDILDPSTVKISKIGNYTITPKSEYDGMGQIDLLVSHNETKYISTDGNYNVNNCSSVNVETGAPTLYRIVDKLVGDDIIKYILFNKQPIEINGEVGGSVLFNDRLPAEDYWWLIFKDHKSSLQNVFANQSSSIYRVETPKNIDIINKNDFYGDTIERLTFNGTKIADEAFSGATLYDLVLNSSISQCGKNIFKNSSLCDDFEFGEKLSDLKDITGILANTTKINSFNISGWDMSKVEYGNVFGTKDDSSISEDLIRISNAGSVFNGLGSNLKDEILDLYNIPAVCMNPDLPSEMVNGLASIYPNDNLLNSKKIRINTKYDGSVYETMSERKIDLANKGWYLIDYINKFNVELGSYYADTSVSCLDSSNIIMVDKPYSVYEIYINNSELDQCIFVKIDKELNDINIDVSGNTAAVSFNSTYQQSTFRTSILDNIPVKLVYSDNNFAVYIIDENEKLIAISLYGRLSGGNDLNKTKIMISNENSITSALIYIMQRDDGIGTEHTYDISDRYLYNVNCTMKQLISHDSSSNKMDRHYLYDPSVYETLTPADYTTNYKFVHDEDRDINKYIVDKDVIKSQRFCEMVHASDVINLNFDLTYGNREISDYLCGLVEDAMYELTIADEYVFNGIIEKVGKDYRLSDFINKKVRNNPLDMLPIISMSYYIGNELKTMEFDNKIFDGKKYVEKYYDCDDDKADETSMFSGDELKNMVYKPFRIVYNSSSMSTIGQNIIEGQRDQDIVIGYLKPVSILYINEQNINVMDPKICKHKILSTNWSLVINKKRLKTKIDICGDIIINMDWNGTKYNFTIHG